MFGTAHTAAEEPRERGQELIAASEVSRNYRACGRAADIRGYVVTLEIFCVSVMGMFG